MVGHGAAEARRPAPADCVGEVRHSHSDALREVEILHAGREIEQHMARYAETSNFADIGAAHAARHRMQMLIADRSPEQVARMEREQAERMAREPGATQ